MEGGERFFKHIFRRLCVAGQGSLRPSPYSCGTRSARCPIFPIAPLRRSGRPVGGHSDGAPSIARTSLSVTISIIGSSGDGSKPSAK